MMSPMLGYSSGQRGQTVNLLLHGYIGSNPIPSTLIIILELHIESV